MTPAIDPVQYPSITIGGETFEVYFRQCDMIRLWKEDQIDVSAPSAPIRVLSPANIEFNLKLLRAGLAHAKDISFGELSEVLGYERTAEVNRVVRDAIKKAQAQCVAILNEDAAAIEREKAQATESNPGSTT